VKPREGASSAARIVASFIFGANSMAGRSLIAGRSKFEESQVTISSNKPSAARVASARDETEGGSMGALGSNRSRQWALDETANVSEAMTASKRNCFDMKTFSEVVRDRNSLRKISQQLKLLEA
jgi:hypothetical protein